MEWNVYYHDVNKQEIRPLNIFNHSRFNKDVQEHLKKCKDKNEFAENLRKELMYNFWCKSEYEVIITSFPPYIEMNELDRLNRERDSHREKYNRDLIRLDVDLDTEIKVDICSQVMLNWDRFLNYVWDSKKR